MVQTCYICKWRADKVPRRSFHKFPYDQAEKQKWLDVIGKSNVFLGKRTSVCSIHFDKTCFRYGLVNGRELLRQGSVPSLQLTRPPEVDPYEELYMNEDTVDVKVEPQSDDDSTEDIDPNADTEDNVADTTSSAGESMHQKIKTENEENVQEPTTNEPITIEVPQTSYKKTTSKAKSKQNGGRIVKIDVSKEKDFLKKKSMLVRMLVEKLRRDHIKLKNHIQSLEERQKTSTKKRRRKKIEVTIEVNGDE